MLNFILKPIYFLLSIFLFMILIYYTIYTYFILSGTNSADIILGSTHFYLLISFAVIVATFIQASLFHTIALKINALTQRFITLLLIISSVIITSPMIYFLLEKVESNVVNIIIIMIPFGIILPTISAIFLNKLIYQFIKPKLLKRFR